MVSKVEGTSSNASVNVNIRSALFVFCVDNMMHMLRDCTEAVEAG